ncbi:class I SAM-dependent methyltransferase [uncultured Parabacteroides sp.]|uniref:class I SAM-dependent methyltransferase n=1 Tax=uncultured Parabacteroides sp. TaxID=512312 RepID=UPI0026165158|nr:class I SAM-dependent methyltransferase [uncultured Parabacteroides sp.]
METKIKLNFQDKVAETLLIPLWMRAQETQRKDAIIRDEKACEIVCHLDYDFSQFSNDKMSLLGVSIRTRYLDRVTQRFIDREQKPVIVLLGCGFDTRFQRLRNREKAICYELDLPEVMNLRSQLLPETENDRYISASMFSTAWMEQLRKQHAHQPFIFICEGVLMYFEIEMVKQFIQDLAAHFPDSELYIERSGTIMVNKAKMHSSVKHTKAQFKSGIDNPHEVETWASNIQLLDTFYFMDDERKRGGIAGWFMRQIPALHRSCGIWGYRITAERK